ncbi:hypothetical protein RclHR1_00350007 [Rhizophagus clarus]|uniref:Uncharacterized protein n=1 Tax=Rhizophagus clarus TaxID=94130 RepID=A0A2Z6RS58_9GLOM|nr:hypothetical protein RclHR1_00350007 [Rhizophagus clarus]
MNTTNRTLELRLPDEYYELDSKIEVNKEEKINFIINRNISNISSFIFYRLPDEYYELDSGIRLPDEYYKLDSEIGINGEEENTNSFFGDRTSLNLHEDNVRRDWVKNSLSNIKEIY